MPRVRQGEQEDAVETVRSAPVPWSGRIRAPDSLDLSRDRGERFQVWKESWDDYVLLTGLDRADPNIQVAALKNVMTAESRRILRNLDIAESDRADLDAQRCRKYAGCHKLHVMYACSVTRWQGWQFSHFWVFLRTQTFSTPRFKLDKMQEYIL